MNSAAEYLRSVVRVFPDYARTVIWFAPGPVHYDDAKVSAELRDAMVAWEADWYAGLTDDLEWASAEIEQRVVAEGERLARMLSAEIGDLLEVEFDTTGDPARKRVRGSGPGTNAAAREAFQLMAEEAEADERRTDALKARGGVFTVYTPTTRSSWMPSSGD
jgi:hypothetical protein